MKIDAWLLSIISVAVLAVQAGCGIACGGDDTVSVVFAEKAKALVPVVVPVDQSSDEKLAARELKKYLDLITGADFAIKTDNEFSGELFISIGKTTQALAKGIDFASLQKEELGIMPDNGALYIYGGAGGGAVNAVMSLLEDDLGCRWYSDQWEKIPHNPDLAVAVEKRRSAPDFGERFVFTAHAMSKDPTWTMHNRVMKWNKYNHVDGWFCHTYENIVPMSEFSAHPELFAKDAKGKPFNTQLCPSNREVHRRAKERILAALRKNKDGSAYKVSLTENDGMTNYCHCPVCEKINHKSGSPIAAHLGLVNDVADAVRNDFPDAKIEFIVYSKYLRLPPKGVRIASNVSMWFCSYNISPVEKFCLNKNAVAEFSAWNKLVDTCTIWEYSCDYANYLRVMPSLPAKIDNLRYWKSQNVDGIMFLEVFGGRGGGQQALRAWILSKLLWDSSLDEDKLARDFCDGVFGIAGPEMYDYYKLVNAAGEEQKTLEEYYGIHNFLKKSNSIFARAYAKAKDDPELKRRIDLHYVTTAFMEVDDIYNNYPKNKGKFSSARFASQFSRIKEIAEREKIMAYSETRSMAGRFADLEILKNMSENKGTIAINACNGKLYQYPNRKDSLSETGTAPLLPCNDNWLVQWELPVNLLEKGKRYRIRAQLRAAEDSTEPEEIAITAGVHRKSEPIEGFPVRFKAERLASKEYRWFNIGKGFVPKDKDYLWFAAAAGSHTGGVFVDRVELIPCR